MERVRYPVDLHMHTRCQQIRIYAALSQIHCPFQNKRALNLSGSPIAGLDKEDAPHHRNFINMRIWPGAVDG